MTMDERGDRPAEEGRAEAVAPEQAPAEGTGSMEEMRALVTHYKREAEHNWQQFLHAAADLENYKKQAVRQRDEAVQRVRHSLLNVVLDVVDNLERALEHRTSGDEGAILEGIRMTHRRVMDLLQNMGVVPMKAAGKPFDPRCHEAIDVVSHRDLGVDPDTVAAEIQRGYMLGGEVLRPARVRVAK
jgi:molecular chaperone GrpE